MQKITPFLWFDDNAEEAIQFYTSIFKNSKIDQISRYGETGPGQKGKMMAGTFEMEGLQVMALNGGPHFKFNESISFLVDCKNQEEVDYYWERLLAGGGQESQCGWLKDKFGLSWQIVPTALGEMMSDKNAAKAKAVTEAMLKMVKLDIKGLQAAYDSVR